MRKRAQRLKQPKTSTVTIEVGIFSSGDPRFLRFRLDPAARLDWGAILGSGHHMHNLFDALDLLGYGWGVVRPSDIGAPDSALVIVNGYRVGATGGIVDGNFWWYPGFADPVEVLRDTGTVVFEVLRKSSTGWEPVRYDD